MSQCEPQPENGFRRRITSKYTRACRLLGWNSGFHYYLIPVVPFLLFHDRLSTGVVVAGSALVVVGALLLERVLRLPDTEDDLDATSGEQRS